ncbi:MAG: hypothetical protein ACKN9E_04075 [Microcystaceae cyanobacterium]
MAFCLKIQKFCGWHLLIPRSANNRHLLLPRLGDRSEHLPNRWLVVGGGSHGRDYRLLE